MALQRKRREGRRAHGGGFTARGVNRSSWNCRTGMAGRWGCSLWNGCLDQCWHQCGREGTTPLSQASQLCVSGPQAPGDSLPSLSSPSQPGGPDPVTSSVDWEGPTVHCRGKLPVSFSPPSPRTPVKHAGRAGIPRNWIPPPEPPSNMRGGWDSPCPDFKTAAPPLWIHSFWKYPWWPLCLGPGNDSDYTLCQGPT